MSQKSGSELRIRCEEALHRELAEAARREMRSLTREVIFRLKASLQDRARSQERTNQAA
jgi:predicted HicB family RNase H-like nuclease